MVRPVLGSILGPGLRLRLSELRTSQADTKVKDAQVFINGSYAGTTHENKTMRLRPGTYNFEIREGGRTQFAQQIYVAA
jgi:hypothetical protein